ncbi:hypothetical protein M2352_003670 [Azospirillum fermentarium]|uniref:phage baseplate assembly protein V n=1 Tax=Azospirillum fermentarium TaxID=1233114 RepID=UPI002226F750|nr:phage baseplate assembly protein V [Azospirillum fermentarium]MCW2248036.1 hypothetical protein [Azospirillum fermentarium]
MSQIELGVVQSDTPDEYGRVSVLPNFVNDPSYVVWAEVAQAWAGDNFGVRFTPREGDTVVLLYPSHGSNSPIVVGNLNSRANNTRHTVYNPTDEDRVEALYANVKGGLEKLKPYSNSDRNSYIEADATENAHEAIKANRNFTLDVTAANGKSLGGKFSKGKSFAAPAYDVFRTQPDDDSTESQYQKGMGPQEAEVTTNQWRSVLRSKIRDAGSGSGGISSDADYSGKYHEIVFDDNPSSPMVAITARGERLDYTDGDLHEVVQGDRHTRVVGTDYRYVEGDEYLHVQGDQHVYVNGDLYTTYIGDTYTTNWGTDRVVFYGFDDSIYYGEARSSMYGYSYSYNDGDVEEVSYGNVKSYSEGDTDSFTKGNTKEVYHGAVSSSFMGAVNENFLSAANANHLGAVAEFFLGGTLEVKIAAAAEIFLGFMFECCLAYKVEVNPQGDAEAKKDKAELVAEIEAKITTAKAEVTSATDTKIKGLETKIGTIETKINSLTVKP